MMLSLKNKTTETPKTTKDDDCSSVDVHDNDNDNDYSESTEAFSQQERQPSILLNDDKERKSLCIARSLVFGVLAIAAILVTTTTYLVILEHETNDFEQEYKNVGEQIVGEIEEDFISPMFNALKGVSEMMTTMFHHMESHNTSDSNAMYHFFTLPDVEQHFHTTRDTTAAKVISYVPLLHSAEAYHAWAEYSVQNNDWIPKQQPPPPQSLIIKEEDEVFVSRNVSDATSSSDSRSSMTPQVWYYESHNHEHHSEEESDFHDTILERKRIIRDPNTGPFAPIWTISPPPIPGDPNIVNFDMLSLEFFRQATEYIHKFRKPVFVDVPHDDSLWLNHWEHSEAELHDDDDDDDNDNDSEHEEHETEEDDHDHRSLNEDHLDNHEHDDDHDDHDDDDNEHQHTQFNNHGQPNTMTIFPIFADLQSSADASEIVGYLFAVIPWDALLSTSENEQTSMIAVVRNNHNETFSYHLTKESAEYLGDVDAHDPTYDQFEITKTLSNSVSRDDIRKAGYGNLGLNVISIYPTQELEDAFHSNEPIWYMLIVLASFLFTSVVFFIYDLRVRQRQAREMRINHYIVSSMFPKMVQDRLVEEVREKVIVGTTKNNKKLPNNAAAAAVAAKRDDRPIADLYPETTIMFADLAGFTAWSSTREPCQVFTLLESVYSAFDTIANHRRVYKVETVGDCYVAACGLPEPRKDHAIAMARFARDCSSKLHRVTKSLEVVCGPDTSYLELRVGLHSGPVTAGVLRGDRARFQLFGDVMNTASRMESTGVPGKIQISQDTANLLKLAGKDHWFVERPDKVTAKGKGELTTYFLTLRDQNGVTSSQGSSENNNSFKNGIDVESPEEYSEESKRSSLVNWQTEILLHSLQALVAMRTAKAVRPDPTSEIACLEQNLCEQQGSMSVLDEFDEIINLPSGKPPSNVMNSEKVELNATIVNQLRDFVDCVSCLYRKNPFHNFEHACHVTMSVGKMLARIASDTHYGLTYSDPLTQFSMLFSALIHDVDHRGIPNPQLAKEAPELNSLYKGRSLAEQNSVDVAWSLLMEKRFADLRATLYVNESELRQFRQLVVNCVMSTDIMDLDLKKLRNDRWERAFKTLEVKTLESEEDSLNRRATIVIEHTMQASDVAHTMQHWHIYRRWNERLFRELYKAYKGGHAEKNPADFWYEGEKGFFDFYILPLANKLKECGVFGVSYDEYLSYAIQNRKEWEQKGQEIVAEMVQQIEEEFIAL